MASHMVRRFGFSDLIGPVAHAADPDTPISPATQAAIESEIRGLIDDAQTRAMLLLKEKRVELERLAKALVEHETLDLSEVRKGESGFSSLSALAFSFFCRRRDGRRTRGSEEPFTDQLFFLLQS
jgi:ATP-dependent Zn protease